MTTVAPRADPLMDHQYLSEFATSPRYLRFGPFSVDRQRQQVYRDGGKLRLQGKVYQVLLVLIEKQGEVVTREQLRQALWPADTHVNYDANVNTTVNKLRLALGDSPEQPAYIETIPRLGYCFVGPVERRSELPKAPAEAHPSAPAQKPEHEAVKPLTPTTAELWAGWKSKGLAAVVLLCGMLIGMGIVLLAHRT